MIILEEQLMSKTIYQSRITHVTTLDDEGNWNCTCKGYQFRQRCYHVSEALKDIDALPISDRIAMKLMVMNIDQIDNLFNM
jgi:hypothetical protein